MPHLFCFGEVEKDVYQAYGHMVDHFHPIGSIKAGYYFTEMVRERPAIEFDICIVSQWATAVMLDGAYPEIKRSLEIMDGFLARYLKEHALRLCIALRESTPEEIAYFERHYAGEAVLIPQNYEAMSTYAAIDQSAIIVVLDSTVGREAYGLGKKVLFCNFTGHDMYDTPAHPSCFVNQERYETFNDRLEWIRHENPSRYYLTTVTAASYLMTNLPDQPAHTLMRKALRSAISVRDRIH